MREINSLPKLATLTVYFDVSASDTMDGTVFRFLQALAQVFFPQAKPPA